MEEIISKTTFTVESPAFRDGQKIPARYTCDGENINPELSFKNLPPGTKSIALIMDDIDAPRGSYIHWLMWNIPPQGNIPENNSKGVYGTNTRGVTKYYGPCPPGGVHRFHFKLYALDTELNLSKVTEKEGLIRAMEGHVLGTGLLIGTYGK